ncbi:3-deoxy-D-manno-oct-2-ulosonic acid (Kdo) hydroxylase [Bordetella sp. H567]|nr:Kdo hydroxylase family protein [Bordetella sp. H567]AOB31686.1 3-deoxy-D-manno-oct-2-ulosonic acid (Kdo) hydroxylase [Bordetella sp. H567]
MDFPLRDWSAPGVPALAGEASDALEHGRVLHFPLLGFHLLEEETALLDPALTHPKRKNISLSAGGVSGSVATGAQLALLHGLLRRYRDQASTLLDALFPRYRDARHTPATSLRLHAIGSWQPSWRKDDRRLLVDAFPSRPIHGERILRVFTNIHPDPKQVRAWRVGEPFEEVARRYLPRLDRPWRPMMAALMHRVGITKRRRTEYDHLMLQLHDQMKRDEAYQRGGVWLDVGFRPGSSWICFSDQVPHAAMSGQFMLEQTWMVPLSAMALPELAPVRVLERLTGRRLLAA